MIRRNFLKGVPLFGLGSLFTSSPYAVEGYEVINNVPDRTYWIRTLTTIVDPVLNSLSQDKLKQQMPVESVAGALEGRKKVTYLEALGRTLAGLAPWLELGADDSDEGKLRKKYIDLSVQSIRHAVTPSSSNFMNFTEGGQPLVDAAFLAHALLRAPSQLWGNLDSTTRQHLVNALRATRAIKPHYSNWLLFTAMVEAALLKFTKQYDAVRIDYALKQHDSWYKGDGVYGDGPEFHFDYYNSFVIHPMILDVVKTIAEEANTGKEMLDKVIKRAKRYGEIQERLISPEGSFPPVGRSLAYRCGAFQLLAQLALQKQLPESLSPAQVRSALTAAIKRSLEPKETFDGGGWLRTGFAGHQPGVAESYISTGSLYLCTTAFLPLGLPSTDDFWTGPSVAWTSKLAYSGKPFPIDKAL